MRTRRNSDEYVRSLEQRVKAGDLTLVGALARAYERMGRGEPPIEPVIAQAVGLAREVLAQISEEQGDVARWNVGGDGYRASGLLGVVDGLLNGREINVEARVADIMREPEMEDEEAATCSRCDVIVPGDEVQFDDDGNAYCHDCISTARLAEARERRRRSGSDTFDPAWSHVSGAPRCPAGCPRCGHAGNLHHEAGEHYCAECDSFVGRVVGCPGIEDGASDENDGDSATGNPRRRWFRPGPF